MKVCGGVNSISWVLTLSIVRHVLFQEPYLGLLIYYCWRFRSAVFILLLTDKYLLSACACMSMLREFSWERLLENKLDVPQALIN